MKKTRRFVIARILHIGCNAMDSARVMSWWEVMADHNLTAKEQRLICQRVVKVKECVDDVRKIANHIERSAKAR